MWYNFSRQIKLNNLPSWRHPCLRQLVQRQRVYRPTRKFWQYRWRIGCHWCWVQRWPCWEFRVRCASVESSRPRTYYRRWTCPQFRCGWWSHRLGTWSWGSRGGRWIPCTPFPFHQCKEHGNFQRSLGPHPFSTVKYIRIREVDRIIKLNVKIVKLENIDEMSNIQIIKLAAGRIIE